MGDFQAIRRPDGRAERVRRAVGELGRFDCGRLVGSDAAGARGDRDGIRGHGSALWPGEFHDHVLRRKIPPNFLGGQ